ncbi:hypothetical protein BOW53_04170 [Solemya pervernicosa gill symbiont]|uniref:Uncharacterized protein n=2 Tax=Gammaproteobacteria incertae sedis TaxID=118884 RepID=A0A1T2L888_9GAMM|nr:hypothetical protein [Candidatus Reidiella endopervernicosa]OOZ41319.1 hypothetical protein BOW53_04170 [Solemya pervernicosa gill symbiont]QKQ27705.1 hypothetical protein HUE57_16500 [Candidatus Reidiella endopervernicosa]
MEAVTDESKPTLSLIVDEQDEGVTEIELRPEGRDGQVIYHLACHMHSLIEEGDEDYLEDEGPEWRTTASSEILVSASEVEPLLEQLRSEPIPAVPPQVAESVAPIYTLTLTSGGNNSSYSWQDKAPEAWQLLGRVVTGLLSLADKRCNQQAVVFKVLANPHIE